MKTLKVGIVQSELHWENPEANHQMFKDLIESFEDSADLIVLPEMFTTGFSMHPDTLSEDMSGKSISWLKEMAQVTNTVICGSLIISDQGNNYNRLVWMTPSGSYQYYDKRHLFRMAGEDEQYQSGEQNVICDLGGWKICLQVCYDLRFPVWSRNINNAYDCLIYVANWPKKRNKAWNILLPARAIENQSYVVGVNRIGQDGNDITYSGDSMVLNPLGEKISTVLPYETSAEIVELDLEKLQKFRSSFPAHRDADEFNLNC